MKDGKLMFLCHHRDAYVDGDFSSCVGIGEGVSLLQTLYGKPARTFAYGKGASAVMKAAELFANSQRGSREREVRLCRLCVVFQLAWKLPRNVE